MDKICNFQGKPIRDVFEDLGLTEYYPGKLTIETAKALARKRVVDKEDIPWCFIENIINPSYDGRSIFFLGQDTAGSISGESDDFDWEAELDVDDTELYTFLDVAVIVFLCCDNDCKQFLAQMLNKFELSAPVILPDVSDKGTLVVQSSVLRGITEDVGFESHIPIVSFVAVNGETVIKTKILNTLLIDDAYKPFYDRSLELARMGGASATENFRFGLIEAALSNPHECICHGTVCACTFTKVLLFLNHMAISRDFKPQEDMICKISSLVTIVVDTGKLAGDNETINNIKEIIEKSKQTLIAFTKREDDSLGDCKKGVQELKEVISGTGAQVAILYNRGTGKRDNLDLVRGLMRKKINEIIEMVDSDDITLKEKFENIDLDKIKLEDK